MRHRDGNALKDQAYGERIGASPLNPMKCANSYVLPRRNSYVVDGGPRRDFYRVPRRDLYDENYIQRERKRSGFSLAPRPPGNRQAPGPDARLARLARLCWRRLTITERAIIIGDQTDPRCVPAVPLPQMLLDLIMWRSRRDDKDVCEVSKLDYEMLVNMTTSQLPCTFNGSCHHTRQWPHRVLRVTIASPLPDRSE
jgi:hypothetical protein